MTFRPRLGAAIWMAGLLGLALVAVDAVALRTLFARPIDVVSVFSGLGLGISGLFLGLLACWLYARLSLSYLLDRNRLEIRWPTARQIIPIGAIQDIIPLISWPVVQGFRGFRRLGFLIGCGHVEGMGRVWCCAMRSARNSCYVVTELGMFLISPANSSEMRQAFEDRKRLGPSQPVQQEVIKLQMPDVSLLRDSVSLGLIAAGLWLNILLFAHITLHMVYDSSEIVSSSGSRMLQFSLVSLLVWMLNSALGTMLHRGQRLVAYLLFLAPPMLSTMLVSVAFKTMRAAGWAVLGYRLFAGICLSGIIAMVSYKRRALSDSGALGALVVGTLIFGFGGWAWGFLLIGFFTTSSYLSRYRKEDKRAIAEKFAKGSQRDLGQVLANGGVGAVLAILNHYWPSPAWLPAYVGVMSAVTADTWATEVGVLSKRLPRSVTTWKRVPIGTSGAISLKGSVASLSGALFIGILTVALSAIDSLARRTAITPAVAWQPLVAVAGGVLGSFADSLLGATLQGIYRCDRCDTETERRVHVCGETTRLVRGWVWLNNDWVNLISSIIGGAVALWVALALT